MRSSASPRGANALGAVVVEPNPDGHRLVYVAHLARALGTQGWALVADERITESAEYREHLRGAEPTLLVQPGTSPRDALRAAVRVSRESDRPPVVVPDGDRYLAALLTIPSVWIRSGPPVRVLLMRTAPANGGWRRRLRLWAKQGLAQIVRWTPGATVYFLSDAFGAVGSRPGYRGIVGIPDPVARQAITSQSCAHIPPVAIPTIGIVGGISERKNPLLLIEAAGLEGGMRIVLAGKFDGATSGFAQQSELWRAMTRSGQLVAIDQFLSNRELDSVLRSLDAVAILHDNDAPSGIMAEAALRGVPAIVPDGGWLAEVVRELGGGVSTELNAHGLAKSMRALRTRAPQLRAAASSAGESVGVDKFVRHLLGGKVVDD